MYYLNKNTQYDFATAEEKIRASLKEVGFGILTEIDMKAVMKEKLDKDIQPYKILGACNPNFAYQALQEEQKIGIMLPCNVTIIEQEDGSVDVSIMDPVEALGIIQNETVIPFAKEVREKLEKALGEL